MPPQGGFFYARNKEPSMLTLNTVGAVLGPLAALFVPIFIHMHDLKRLEIAELRGRLDSATKLIQALQVELPSNYMKKDEQREIFARIFDVLDDIREKLNQKADRNEHANQ